MIVAGLFVLAVLSGMVGLGVAFAAVPFLSLFLPDMVRQVQPLTLLLNGATALFASVGFEPKRAAGINALAATPASFAALLPHLGMAEWDPPLTLGLMAAGVVGAFAGARISSTLLPGKALRWLFGGMLVAVSAYKLYTMAA